MTKTNFIKIFRFAKIYGLSKTGFKVAGRLRKRSILFCRKKYRGGRDIGVIGCGQFTFSTVGHTLCSKFGNRFVDCYDVDPTAHETFSEFYSISQPSSDAFELLKNDKVVLVYIASNHYTHTEYAIEAIKNNKVVYLEKPVSVTYSQLNKLNSSVNHNQATIYAGYNRPFSAAIMDMRRLSKNRNGPLTLNCHINGHFLESDHWYRNPEEGTRICGNVGHWLDLAVHILSWNSLPDQWEIHLTYSNKSSRDDDLSISMVSENGDLIVIVLTARSEPFEGINETINLQHDTLICKIDDFRQMKVWDGTRYKINKYWPKDVGHKNALLQPFAEKPHRKWGEVVLSSLLMLHITDMVLNNQSITTFSFSHAKDSYL